MIDSVKSPVDGQSLDGVDCVRVHSSVEYASREQNLALHWTELFFVSSTDAAADAGSDPAELSQLAQQLSQAFTAALGPHLELLAAATTEMMLTMKIGLRVTLSSEQVT